MHRRNRSMHSCEPGAGDRGEEVHALEQRVDFDARLGGGGQGALGLLGRRAEAPEGARVAPHVLAGLPLELGREVVHEALVE